MQLGLINSAWAQTGHETAWGIRKTKEIGFDCIDLFTDPLELDIHDRMLIKEECDRAELPIRSICCVALGLIDFNPSVQQFHIDRCKSFLDLVKEYHADNLLLVLGEYVWNREVIAPEDQWQLAVESCMELAHHADDLGVRIALELEPFPQSLLNSVDKMVSFIDEVDHSAVRANIDISHLLLAGQAPEELRKLKGKAIHVHISDCNGKQHGDLPPGRGVVNFAPYLDEIRALEINGAISIELEYSPDPDKIEEWVSEAYLATDQLMREAGLR